MGYHYPYSASGAHRWSKCFAFKVLEKRAPERKVGEAAKIGTATHYLGEWAMTSGYSSQVDERLLGCYIRLDKHTDAVDIVTGPGGDAASVSMSGIKWVENPRQVTAETPYIYPVDEAMINGVNQYLAIVNGIMTKYGETAKRHVEVSFQLAADMGGMADLVIQTPERLIVLDYKNGHNPVDAINNPQLAIYGIGALSKFAMTGPVAIKDVVMGIVQPNAPGPTLKVWTQTVEELRDWRTSFEAARFRCEQVRQQAEQGKNIDHEAISGGHCKWCSAMTICPAKERETLALARRTMSDLDTPDMPAIAGLDDQRLLWIAEHGDGIIEYIQLCKEYMTTQAVEGGKQWAGFKIVESDTKRKLIDKKVIEKAFKDKGLMEAFEPKLKSLSKLEKIFGKEKMAHLITKPQGAPLMVRDTDGRQPYNQALVAALPALKE